MKTLTHECLDCGEVREVVAGLRQPHDCEMPEHLRGRLARAWIKGYEFALQEEWSCP